MIELNKNEYKRVARLIEADIEKCLYIHMNLINYEKENSSIITYVDNEILPKIIIVEYHNSFQLYERETVSNEITDDILELIKLRTPKMISGTLSFIKRIHKLLGNYEYRSGGIFYENQYRDIPDNGIVCEAEAKDAIEIAELISSNRGIGGHYDLQDLANQLKQRIISKTGRSYVIRENGCIVAHTATYAQTNKYAVISGTIIGLEFRKKNYYMILSNYIIRKLSEEGIRPYTFVINEKMYKYHQKVHELSGTYARLTIKGV